MATRFSNRLAAECGNYPPEAAVGKTKGPYTQTLPTYPDAPATGILQVTHDLFFGTQEILALTRLGRAMMLLHSLSVMGNLGIDSFYLKAQNSL